MEATLGKRITAHRKRLGLTQDQLAEKLGITAQAVSKWENDLSCPDITALPKLADIFGTTVDALLGRETAIPVCETEVVTPGDAEQSGFTFDNGKMEFHWDDSKHSGIGFACWMMLTGIIYLITQLLSVYISFWNVMWPSFLLVFGLFGLYPKFSVFRLGCALAGGTFLMTQFFPVHLEHGVIIAALVVLFGLALLADSLRKARHPESSNKFADQFGKGHHGSPDQNYFAEDDHFTYDANFGNDTRPVVLDHLRSGSIDINFGEYTVDLSGVAAVEPGCKVSAACSFGTLSILIPRRYTVIPDSSTSFAGFEIIGQPETPSQGTIRLSADVSFGQITVEYR